MTEFHHVPCTACGCVCDDIRVVVGGDRIISTTNACCLGEPWFRAQNSKNPPIAEVDGRSADLEFAVGRAAEILRSARYPLIYGLSRSTTEGQRSAVALAESIGATIDTTAATGHAPSLVALQSAGESTCTLGEVRQRADLVIYWGCDPEQTHPRHIERYVDRRKARVVVVDVHETASTRIADQAILIPPDTDWDAVWQLRRRVRSSKSIPHVAGLPQVPEVWADLADRMKVAKFGVVFFGGGLVKNRFAHRNVEALLQLVTDLNDHTRFHARRLRRLGDVAGADSVLTWQTGYPFAVNFSKGYPRYQPGEFSAPAMLARGEPDAVVFVGSETSREFPAEAVDHLRRIPVIALETPQTETMVPAVVRFTTAVHGIHRPGTAYRMDEVPIPLRMLLPTPYPTDGEVLDRIRRKVGRDEIS